MLKLFCILIVAGHVLAEEELLESLYGVNGMNKVTVCGHGGRGAGGGVRCAGALWAPQWVAARAACLAPLSPLAPLAPEHKHPQGVRVVRGADGAGCEHHLSGVAARKVRQLVVHPSYRAAGGAGARYDIALLSLAAPYPSLEPLANVSAAHSQFAQYEMWMNYVIQAHNMEQTTLTLNPFTDKSRMFASPVRMFIATVLLPSTSFIVFFLYVIFYTSPRNKIPYRNCHSQNHSSSV